MRSAMVRNTRAVVALKLPRRHAATIRVDGVEGERAAYLDLATAVRRLAAAAAARDRLSVRHLLAAAGSSPAARRLRSSTCCAAIQPRRNWCSCITAKHSIIWPAG